MTCRNLPLACAHLRMIPVGVKRIVRHLERTRANWLLWRQARRVYRLNDATS
jgi:hypothetical protein